MIKSIGIVAVLGIAAMQFLGMTPASAAPLCQSGVTLQTLIDGGACAIGDKVFSGFALAPNTFSNVTQLDFAATDVSVSVDATPLNPGFAFSLPTLSIGRDQLKEGQIKFSVAVSPGGGLIEDLSLTDSAAAQGAGFAGVSASLSNNAFASIVTNAVQGELVCTPNCAPGTLAEISFTPISSLDVTTAILLNDNAGDQLDPQGASLSAFTINFSEVPEPGTLLLVASSLVLFMYLAGRRQRAIA